MGRTGHRLETTARGALAAALTLAVLAGQGEPAAPADGAASAAAAADFRTPDGSRVLLLPDGGAPLVHWAVATPCGAAIDPLTSPGLAAACAEASLRGTWRTGSFDTDRERAARTALDAAATDLQVAPRSGGAVPAELQAAVDRLRAEAAALCDPLAFRRVLLAAPTTDLELQQSEHATVLTFTTTPLAVAAVAKLLVERREDQALRSVRDDLAARSRAAAARWDEAPLSPLYAELLALAFPGHPLARAGDRPTAADCTRAQALATWNRAQHPLHTVHVLTGNFDPAAVRRALEDAFATTALPAPEPLPAATPRQWPALRRSLVPGAAHPAAVLAVPLRPGDDRAAVQTAARWFAGGDDSWLAREFVRRGRKGVRVETRAPWPEGAGTGMLVIEVQDPGGGAVTLADELLALCAPTAAKAPRAGELAAAFGGVLREFELATRRPDAAAAWFARELLLHPDAAAPPPPPQTPAYPELPALLQGILGRTPIVVEWRDT
ncbi:MAG: hypothetical protein AB7O97_06525 [Planctomycetota bacterium]